MIHTPPSTPLFLDSPWLTELFSGTVDLTLCACQCSCICMACRSTRLSPLALPFALMFQFAPIPLSDPVPVSVSPSHSQSSSSSFSPSRLLSRQLSLPPLRPSRHLLLSRHFSLPPSGRSLHPDATSTACGVNCHKACRGRLAVECRKRTKSISHETPPALQARSYSFPPPANTPPSLQSSGESCLKAIEMVHVAKTHNNHFYLMSCDEQQNKDDSWTTSTKTNFHHHWPGTHFCCSHVIK